LHGGVKGFDKKIWDAEIVSQTPASIRLTYVSSDGEEGYPGKLTTQVTYTVTDSNELAIEFNATTDQDTVLNLTNHSYFNLSGVELNPKILNHEITMNGLKGYLDVDENSLPSGRIIHFSDAPEMDFTGTNAGKAIGSRVEQVQGGGYNHAYVIHENYVIDTTALPLQIDVAIVHSPETGITMKLATTEPSFQFYAGKFIPSDIFTGKKSQNHAAGIGAFSGFCLETSRNPNAPNQENWRSSVLLTPSQKYGGKTVFTFNVRV
jgi:aldose 1-epimerase